MKSWFVKAISLAVFLSAVGSVQAEEKKKSSVDQAREALAKQGDDQDSAKQLEEVFQAAEKNYSLLKKGKKSLSYSFDYSFTADQRIDLEVLNNTIRNLDVTPSATHSFTNSFSFDYGLLNNLTLNARLPISSRFDTQSELSTTDIGDLSLALRWQPFPFTPGKTSVTVFSSFKTKTGVSPYEIDVGRQLSTGSGTYSLSGGVSLSKVLDPVVIFGSLNVGYSFEQSGLNQVRGGRALRVVQPGMTFSLSGGFSYSLSYDTSLSISTNLSYSAETKLFFSDGSRAVAQDSVSGSMNLSMGTRLDAKTIINTSVGFGLTEDASDITLGVSYPINLAGFNF